MQIEQKEYFMAEFRGLLEEYESSRIWGARIVQSGQNAIK